VLLDCVIYCAFYSILFRGAVFFRSRCIASFQLYAFGIIHKPNYCNVVGVYKPVLIISATTTACYTNYVQDIIIYILWQPNCNVCLLVCTNNLTIRPYLLAIEDVNTWWSHRQIVYECVDEHSHFCDVISYSEQ